MPTQVSTMSLSSRYHHVKLSTRSRVVDECWVGEKVVTFADERWRRFSWWIYLYRCRVLRSQSSQTGWKKADIKYGLSVEKQISHFW